MAEGWRDGPLTDGDGASPSVSYVVPLPTTPAMLENLPAGLRSPAGLERQVEAVLARCPPDVDHAGCAAWMSDVEHLLAGELPDLLRARLLEGRAFLWGNGASHDAAARAFHRDALRAATLYEGAGWRLRAALNYAAAGIAAIRDGDIGGALELAVRALVEFGAIEDAEAEPLEHARMANTLGVLCSQFLDYERALTFYALASRRLRQVGDVPRWSAAVHNLTETILLRAGQLDPATHAAERRRLLDQAEAACHELLAGGEPRVVRDVEGRRLLASVLCLRGEPERAWLLLQEATSAAGDPDGHCQLGSLRLVRGRCLRALGRSHEALAELDAALGLVDDAWALAERIDALQQRSALRQDTGDLAGALDDVRRLADLLWARHRRHVGGLMDQVWSRAGVEGERRDLEARAQDLIRTAEQDPLTGLPNRRAMERFLAQLDPQEPISLVVVDVDHFKSVNDRYGHPAGDAVLCEVGDLLTRSVRAVDRVARWGGEEFLVVLPGANRSLGDDAAGRIRGRVETHDWRSVHDDLRLTVSAGVAFGPAFEVTLLLARADEALYAAKDGGRNRVVLG